MTLLKRDAKTWRITYLAPDGSRKDSFQWMSKIKPTRVAKNGCHAGETFIIEGETEVRG
jgi:hypothetical protein